MNNTEHFSIEEWADCSRGLVDGDRRFAMRAHIDAGCRTCAELHTTFRRVSRLALRESSYEPPKAAVRLAVAAFQTREPQGFAYRLSQAAQLLFDSRVVPAPLGVRGSSTTPRRLVFKSGELVIDVQITASDQTRGRLLIGQITARPRTRPLEGMQVLLHSAQRSIAKAPVNRLGEFQMEFENPDGELRLAFVLYNRTTVIPLGTLS